MDYRDCSNCAYKGKGTRCMVMQKVLHDEECYAWANADEAINREMAIANYTGGMTLEIKNSIEKLERRKASGY